MKTFGLFMLLFLITTIGFSLLLTDDWSTPQIIIESTIFAYIMQQYATKENDK